MYAYIKGKLVEKNPAYAVLENEGIGYMINISLHTYTQLKSSETFKLFTHMAIRNEATTPVGFVMFGFADEQERELFRYLISVSGVGNNTALLMLSSLSPDKLVEAIVDDQNRIFPVCAMLNGEYGLKDIYLGVPVKLGKEGIVEIIEIDLNKDEKALLMESAKSVKSVMKVLDDMDMF